MALISLTIKARRGKPVNQVQLIDTDDIMTPVIPTNGGLDSSFVLSERKKGHFSNSNDLVASETYVVDETVQEVTALSSSMFSATVTAQNSKATTPNVVMGFSTHLIAGRVEPNGGGAKFSYQEGGNPALILFQVSDSLSSIASQTTPSGGGGGGGTASSISFVPNGDISSNNVQNAIVEVRDDTDTKLSGKQDSLGFTPENISNKSADIVTDQASNTKFPSVKAVFDWALGLFVQKNANVTAATKTKITYDVKGLVTAGADATTADINDSTNRRYVTDVQLSNISTINSSTVGNKIFNYQNFY